jgi:glycosyltransferase involved in cell wall biosynthesis
MDWKSMTSHKRPLTVVCNPYANYGTTVAALNLVRAFRRVYVNPHICDINSSFNFSRSPDIVTEFGSDFVDTPNEGINIFVANVDEVTLLRNVFGNLPSNSHNILYPTWELSTCPDHWRAEISDFDELWVPSKFVGDAFRGVYENEITIIPYPVDVKFNCLLNRSYFGLPDSSYVFLFPFDFRSYIQRKNPFAFLRVLEQVFKDHPYKDIFLVVKAIGETSSASAIENYSKLECAINNRIFRNRVRLIKGFLSENEKNNLIRNSDCLVSLHRSEGFGLSLAEAMLLGKPVIATGYSGNIDFMNETNSLIVNYELIPVAENDYPEAAGQVWAEPDENQAIEHINRLLESPQLGEEIGSQANLDIRLKLSYLAIGNLMVERIKLIESHLGKSK